MAAEPHLCRAIAAIEAWYRAALDAVEPGAAVRRCLAREESGLIVAGRSVPVEGRLVVLAVGKAAVGMARGVEQVAGDLIADGLAITKDDHVSGPPLQRLTVAEAAHPVPDDRGVRATRQALALAEQLGPSDVLLALISGGGSALLEAPRPPVTLGDMAQSIDLLLRAGAPIQALNAVRTPLSLVKGGGLRRAADGARAVTLILSDVLGNDPRIIASGPTIPAARDPGAALAILDRFGLRGRVPSTIVDALTSDLPTFDAGAGLNRGDDIVEIVGDNDVAIRAAEQAAVKHGLSTSVVWSERRGEAAALGRAWVDECVTAPAPVQVLLGGGEATVTVRGDGLGGRNTEFALAAAIALEEGGHQDWIVASLATDGEDGPTGVAGAVADAGTGSRARAKGVDPRHALDRNDSLRVFEAAGGLIRPGPTGTNVNDLYLAVRAEALAR